MVGHQCQVVVVLLPGDFIHPDIDQGIETGVIELVVHHPLDDRSHVAPGDAQEAGDAALVGVLGQLRGQLLELVGEPGVRAG